MKNRTSNHFRQERRGIREQAREGEVGGREKGEEREKGIPYWSESDRL